MPAAARRERPALVMLRARTLAEPRRLWDDGRSGTLERRCTVLRATLEPVHAEFDGQRAEAADRGCARRLRKPRESGPISRNLHLMENVRNPLLIMKFGRLAGNFAKVEVASSSLVSRSKIPYCIETCAANLDSLRECFLTPRRAAAR